MKGRDFSDLLTRLQYVLNVAHDDGSFSGRSRVLQDSAAYSAVIESLALAFGYRILPSARMEANMRAACNCDGRGQTRGGFFVCKRHHLVSRWLRKLGLAATAVICALSATAQADCSSP
jgi:hypothetical protein